MKPVTLIAELSVGDLQDMAAGRTGSTITDMDFLETLAARRCILVPPEVLRVRPEGGTQRVALIEYDEDMGIDKAKTLLAVMRRLPRKGAEALQGCAP